MRDDVVTRRQLGTKLRGERDEPGLSSAAVHSVEVLRIEGLALLSSPYLKKTTNLVVDIDAVQPVCLDEAGEVVRSRDRVRTGTRRDVARPERGDHKLDAGRVVLRLNRGPVACRECGPLVRLVPRAGSQPERKNAVAIPIRSSIDNE